MRCRTLHGEALFLLRVRVAVRRNRMPRNARAFEAAPEPVCHQCGCPLAGAVGRPCPDGAEAMVVMQNETRM